MHSCYIKNYIYEIEAQMTLNQDKIYINNLQLKKELR